MFIGITTDPEKGFFWEVMTDTFKRVGHGYALTKTEAQESAEKAKEAYLYWLNHYRYRAEF